MYYSDGAEFNDWILRHYNFPSGGLYNVEGDGDSATWNSYIGGEPTYYYYFYY
jgi:hypothetical protein